MQTVRDLLDLQNQTAQFMTSGTKFKPTQITVNNETELINILKRSYDNRKVGVTSMNEQSSRSHCIYQIKVSAERAGETLIKGVVSLIDLAGSERVGKAQVEGDKLKETQSINHSLSALGDVICALKAQEKHIPYRNSKLTHLLQNYLTINSKTLMIVNISPLQSNFQETLTAITFAQKVNQCKTKS